MKIWFDKDLIKEKPRVPFLNPIIGKYKETIWGYDDEQISERETFGKGLLEYVENIKNCDYIVYPKIFDINDFFFIKKYSKKAKKYNKKVIIFSIDDYDIPYNIKNAIIFRTSFSKGHKNEFAMPSFPKDLCKNKIAKKGLSNKISISYCGYIGYDTIKMKIFYYISLIRNYIFRNNKLKKFIFYFLHNNQVFLIIYAGLGRFYRNKMHKACLKIKKYKYNYIIRHSNLDPHNKNKEKQEYIDNIINNDFPLVIRGSGNYSFRLYEIMSLGKIPIFVNTKCILPFEDKIDYKNLFIWVPFSDINRLENYIDIYISKNINNIENNQNKIKEIYDEYLTVCGFYKHIIKDLENNKY